ncbi:hypothetical protein [Aquimarina brevivitae]|uniref:Uncharacterized protein n=1 Tax=Aquimarina brevivitae TaxID=323412 RepID=A0A4Q7PG16_9FLAO|nr:hypothetical protein [Aquimarina brevivitae]RZS99453.1 hypothetical protein EV197_0663 [Aquimarina brevivitae]
MKKAVNKLTLHKIQVTELTNTSAIKGGYYGYCANTGNGDDDDTTIDPTQTKTHRFK